MKISVRYGRYLTKRFVLFLCVCALLSLAACTDYDTPREWTPVYNPNEHVMFISAMWPVAFEEYLTPSDIEKILPSKPLPVDVYKAKAMFREDRSVYQIVLYIEASGGGEMALALGEGSVWNGCCVFSAEGGIKSLCGNVEYTLYELSDDLMAKAVFNDIPMCARTFGTMDKQEFETILECFSWYSKGKPNLSTIVPREH